MELLCPICGQILRLEGRACACENRHSFDVARQGYVNLLTVQQKHSLNPGDTKEQVLSRRGFLDGGFYKPIVDTLIAQAKAAGTKVISWFVLSGEVVNKVEEILEYVSSGSLTIGAVCGIIHLFA